MHTRVTHSVTGAEWDCPTKALDHFLSIGWELPAESDEDPAPAQHDAALSPAAEEQE